MKRILLVTPVFNPSIRFPRLPMRFYHTLQIRTPRQVESGSPLPTFNVATSMRMCEGVLDLSVVHSGLRLQCSVCKKDAAAHLADPLTTLALWFMNPMIAQGMPQMLSSLTDETSGELDPKRFPGTIYCLKVGNSGPADILYGGITCRTDTKQEFDLCLKVPPEANWHNSYGAWAVATFYDRMAQLHAQFAHDTRRMFRL